MSKKVKIQIKHYLTGKVLFEYESVNNTIKKTLEEAVKSGSDLRGSDLRYSDLRDSDLRGSDLQSIKADVWELLINAIPEIPALRQAIIDGKIDGSIYEGECACLCGTIANVRGCDYTKLEGIKPDSSRPAEAFFYGVKKGDTPETNQISKLVLEWLDELQALLNAPKPKITGKTEK
jgi:hypothetical protein